MSKIKIGNELNSQLMDLAVACRLLAMEGHEDGTQGHLSLRDPEGRGVWLKRMGTPLGNIWTADDFVLIDFDGNILAGEGRRHAEWPIHTEIMKARIDVNVVGHAHPHFATLFSSLEEEFKPFVQEGYRVRGHKVPRYEDTSTLILNHELGAGLAKALGPYWAVLMRNHGVSFCGEGIADATLTALYFERACKAFFEVKATGLPFRVPNDEELAHHATIFGSEWFIEDNWGFFLNQLEAYESGAKR